MIDPDETDDARSDLPAEDLGGERYASEESVLTPEDLDIAESEHVAQLSDNRYVVSPDPIYSGHTPARTRDADTPGGRSGADDSVERPGSTAPAERPDSENAQSTDRSDQNTSTDATETTIDAAAARRQIAEELVDIECTYSFEIVATFDGTVGFRRVGSNDVVATFERLLRWYARQVTDDVSPDRALGVLLSEASLPITYPTSTLDEVLTEQDLDRGDSIGDLLDAIESYSDRK